MIGRVIGPKTDEWIPKKKIRQIMKCRNKTAHGLSMEPTSGARNCVRICGGSAPKICWEKKRTAMKVPATMMVVGIQLKGFGYECPVPPLRHADVDSFPEAIQLCKATDQHGTEQTLCTEVGDADTALYVFSSHKQESKVIRRDSPEYTACK